MGSGKDREITELAENALRELISFLDHWKSRNIDLIPELLIGRMEWVIEQSTLDYDKRCLILDECIKILEEALEKKVGSQQDLSDN